MPDFDPKKFLQQLDAEDSGFDPHQFLGQLDAEDAADAQRRLHDVESSFLTPIARAAQAVDSYTGAPVRAGVGALQEGQGLSGALSAAKKQFGEDTATAPSGKDLVAKMGVPTKEFDLPLIANPYTGQKVSASPAGILGAGAEAVLDPTTYIPGAGIAKGGELALRGAENLAPKVAKYLGNIAEERAAKASIGGGQINMLRKAAKASPKGALNPAAVGDEIRNYGRTLLNADEAGPSVISRFSTPQDIGQAAEGKRQFFGNKIGQVAEEVDEKSMPKIPQVGEKLDLGDGYSLEYANENPSTSYTTKQTGQTSTGRWLLKDPDGKRIGHFFTDTYENPKLGNYTSVRQAQIEDVSAQGKGLGTKVYSALNDRYGNLISDANTTSPTAKRVWEKIGGRPATDISDALESGKDMPLNAAGETRQYVPPKPVGIISGQDLADEVRSYKETIPNHGKGRSVRKALEEEALEMERKGNYTFEEAQAAKNQFKYEKGASDALIDSQDAANQMNKIFGGAMDEAAGKTSPQVSAKYKSAKEGYGPNAIASQAGGQQVIRNLSNRFLEPSTMGMGLGTMVGSAASGDSLSGAGIKGMLAGALNKQVLSRGNSFVARSADDISKMILASPQKFSRFLPLFQSAAKRGNNGVVALHHLLMNNDPTYRDIINAKEGDENERIPSS